MIAEREYLIPAYSLDGSGTFKSEGKEFLEYEFERRPVYVMKLTQLDPSYVYSYRIQYYDKETFRLLCTENYDQKGRLYRTLDERQYFNPEMGIFTLNDILYHDHVDLHSSWQRGYCVPAPMVTRDDVSVRQMILTK